MEIKKLNKKASLLENGTVSIEETTKTTKSKQELINERDNFRRQKQSLIEQSKRSKEQYTLCDEKEKEIDELLKLFPADEIETL